MLRQKDGCKFTASQLRFNYLLNSGSRALLVQLPNLHTGNEISQAAVNDQCNEAYVKGLLENCTWIVFKNVPHVPGPSLCRGRSHELWCLQLGLSPSLPQAASPSLQVLGADVTRPPSSIWALLTQTAYPP